MSDAFVFGYFWAWYPCTSMIGRVCGWEQVFVFDVPATPCDQFDEDLFENLFDRED